MSDVRVVAAGDAMLVAEFDARIDPAVNDRVLALAAALGRAALPGVRDIVPTFRTVAVHYDPLATDVARLAVVMAETPTRSNDDAPVHRRRVTIPVCYDSTFAPDMDRVAAFGGLSRHEVVAAHTAREYRVYMLGFVPGFAYLGSVDPRLAAPRLSSPRVEVAAGAVGIAGEQTGVYPSATPGGWNIIGRTPLRLVALERAAPALLAAGDIVSFRAIDRAEFTRIHAEEHAA
jgi:inhibitor of KinA